MHNFRLQILFHGYLSHLGRSCNIGQFTHVDIRFGNAHVLQQCGETLSDGAQAVHVAVVVPEFQLPGGG